MSDVKAIAPQALDLLEDTAELLTDTQSDSIPIPPRESSAARQQTRRFVPSDRFVPVDPLFSDEWHLVNSGQTGGTPGADANVVAAWDRVRGTGVTIAIVDDGLQYTHPDLSAQYVAELSFDFNDNDPDPLPDTAADFHGTAVAGVAAARGDNDIGVSGAAPGASLAGIRLVAGPSTDLQEASALTYKNQEIDIYNNSWGPGDSGTGLAAPGPLTLAALREGVTSGRGGLGSIFVWAAGNGRLNNDNVNYDGYANSRYTIAVSAIDHNGVQSSYSEPGAPILVAAYSSGDRIGITTTDLVGDNGYDGKGDYTNTFGGTSSATPLVSGVIALMLEANPNLTWRDVQHILVETARQNDVGDSDWSVNGAGHLVNHKYGFGAIDAAAAVDAAIAWTSVEPEVDLSSGVVEVDTVIPDANPVGLASTVTITQDIDIEWVEVVFDADHSYRGDLSVVLTSPDGTESILAEAHNDPNDDYDSWTFTSARHWDESSVGEWTLRVVDGVAQDIGTWDFWQLNLYGTTRSEAAPEWGVDPVTGSSEVSLEGAIAAPIDGGDDLLFAGVTGNSSESNPVGFPEESAAGVPELASTVQIEAELGISSPVGGVAAAEQELFAQNLGDSAMGTWANPIAPVGMQDVLVGV